jgi:ribosomal protein S5
VQRAVSAAFFKSYANIVNVPLYRGHTIYHRIEYKRHTTNILMIPREFGKGIRASNLMYELCVLAGIQDITVQVRPRAGSRCYCFACLAHAQPAGMPCRR